MACVKRYLSMYLLSFALLKIASASQKPNVLFIVADDLRPTLGCYGDDLMVTPNIDQLAAKSVLFERAVVQQAVCGPSRVSFLTSRRPDSTRLYNFSSYWRKAAGNYTTLPQYFKENGYYTYSIGKVFHPGIAGGPKRDDMPYSWSETPYHPPTQQFKNAKVCKNLDGTLHSNLICPIANITALPGKSLPDIESKNQALEVLKNYSQGAQGDKPLFLAVGFHKPHIPLKYPAKFIDLYPLSSMKLASNTDLPKKLPPIAYETWTDVRDREDVMRLDVPFPHGPIPKDFQIKIRQSYYAAVSYMDSLLGEILDTLDKLGMANNTIISFVGDHGWQLGEHAEWAKYSNYEVAVRVPLLFSMPGVTFKPVDIPGKTYPHIDPLQVTPRQQASRPISDGSHSYKKTSSLVELVDMFPTIAEMAGLQPLTQCPVPSNKVMLCTEGHSMAPLIYNISGVAPSGIKPQALERWKNATFSQYPRHSTTPDNTTDLQPLKDIKWMGYSMRTDTYRYTEWVRYNRSAWHGNWELIHAREFYLHTTDPLEDDNLADEPAYRSRVKQASYNLHRGWQHALPVYKTTAETNHIPGTRTDDDNVLSNVERLHENTKLEILRGNKL